MPQRTFRRKSTATNPASDQTSDRSHPVSPRTAQHPDRSNQKWDDLRTPDRYSSAACNSLTSLIEKDAPLQAHTALVLMYGPFQAELQPEKGQGVATWLRECVHKHGLPSLVRFDYRYRAQVFRRDQFQSWLEPLLDKVSS